MAHTQFDFQVRWNPCFGPDLLTSWTPRTLLTTASSIRISWFGWGGRPCQISESCTDESRRGITPRVCRQETTPLKLPTVSLHTVLRVVGLAWVLCLKITLAIFHLDSNLLSSHRLVMFNFLHHAGLTDTRTINFSTYWHCSAFYAFHRCSHFVRYK